MKPAAPATHGEDIQSGDVSQAPETRANRYEVVSRLADDLAHEIKNPLNAIVVNLEVLRRKIASGAHETALERANVIEQEIGRVHGLVDQLLQLMRPPRIDPNAISIDDALEDMRPLIEVQARAARVDFIMHATSGAFTKAGKDRLKFALLNLVTAVHADESGVQSILIEAHSDESNVEITVSCNTPVFRDDGEFVQHARALAEMGLGSLEIRAPNTAGAGSAAVLRVPACSSFA